MRLREGLETLKPYSVEEDTWPVKADANEMPHGWNDEVKKRVTEAMAAVAGNRYPQITANSLRQLLADDLGFALENVLVGNGSSELLAAVTYAFGGKDRSVVFPTPSFSMYGVYVKLSDSDPVPVKLTKGYALPVSELIETARNTDAALVLLCNPNNPTGTITAQEDIETILQGVSCPVVVDEAYYEFYGESSIKLIKKYPNLIVTRTFSKAFGLAAGRVGYLVGNAEAVAAIGKVLMPYHVNAFSLAAAEAVYRSRSELTGAIRRISAERERLADQLGQIQQVTVYPSNANFLLVRTETAQELTAFYAQQGIGVRHFSGSPGLEGCIRITVGTPAENEAVILATQTFFAKK